jgi:hypothetical protein
MTLLSKLRPRPAIVSETDRVIGLPVRPPFDLDRYDGPDLTPELSLGVSDWALKPVQSWALEEIRVNKGAVLAVGVGHGKTLIAYATPVVLGIDPADVLVLVPANLRDTFRREGLKYAEHLRTPAELPVLSYAELSRPAALDYLDRVRPKVIICDEAHYLRSSDSTRTRRFMRYLKAHPDVALVAMTGTLFTSSIRDGQALITRALGAGAPVPAAYSTLEWWAACVDVPRAHEQSATHADFNKLRPLVRAFGTGAAFDDMTLAERKVEARAAFHNRFVRTPGVVHTTESAAKNALFIQPIRPAIPADVSVLIDEVESSWTRPDGVLLDDDLRVNEVLRGLALGYYNTWDWGANGEDTDWNDARLEYARQVNRFLKRDRPGIDSPYLVEQAILRGLEQDPFYRWSSPLPEHLKGPSLRSVDRPDLVAAYLAWAAVKDRAAPDTVPVIVTEAVMSSVVKFASARVKADKARGIVWYEHEAAADILDALGVRVYRPGTDPEADPNPVGTVAGMSVAAHGTGKNLQAWSHSFVTYPPANGKTWEQLIGRTHRPGQIADEVWVYPCVHSPEHAQALTRAREHAEFAAPVQGQAQKLTLATWFPEKFI